MLKKSLLLTLLMLSPMKAGDPWTKKEITLETAYQVLLFIDWKQTSEYHRSKIIYSDGSTYEIFERNPLLGTHPKQSTINTACLLSSIGHLAISNVLSHKKRNLWQSITVGIELFVVSNNHYEAQVSIRW